MPISVGIVGYEVEQHERVAALIAAVGGPVKAAALIKRTRTHVDNMRKPGARLSLDDLLPICVEAGVSLDWVATGHQQRPDLEAVAAPSASYIELQPLTSETPHVELGFSPRWLDRSLGVKPDDARYAVLDDDGMSPPLGKGAVVIVDTKAGKLRSGGRYLLCIDDEVVARRVNRMPDGKLELVADLNGKWRYELKDPAELTLHRIVWAGSPV